MPNYIGDPALSLQAQIAQLQRQVKALASQQNLVISNNQRQKVLTLGTAASLPGSSYSAPDSSDTPTFAMQLLNPNGTPMMQVGEQFDTTYSPGMVFFAANGDILTVLDDSGLTVNDSSGNTRVQLGALPNGDYGLEITDAAGLAQVVNPLYAQTGASSTTLAEATSWSSFSFPTLTAPIGPSGKALIMVGAWLQSPSGGSIALGLEVNGVAPTYGSIYSDISGKGSFGYMYVAAGLPQGSITFTLVYQTGSVSGNYTIESPSLVIWPL